MKFPNLKTRILSVTKKILQIIGVFRQLCCLCFCDISQKNFEGAFIRCYTVFSRIMKRLPFFTVYIVHLCIATYWLKNTALVGIVYYIHNMNGTYQSTFLLFSSLHPSLSVRDSPVWSRTKTKIRKYSRLQCMLT